MRSNDTPAPSAMPRTSSSSSGVVRLDRRQESRRVRAARRRGRPAGMPMRSPTSASHRSSASAIRLAQRFAVLPGRGRGPSRRRRRSGRGRRPSARMVPAVAAEARVESAGPWGATRATTSSSSPSRSGRRRCETASTRCRTAPGFGVEKPWSQAAHRAVKAEGGWAAVCTEYCTVSLDADETPFISARMWDDHDLAHLRARSRGGAQARLAGGHRALALGRARRELRDAPPAAGAVADRERLLEHHAEADGAVGHRPDRRRLRDGRDPLARRRLRHRLRLRRALLPARADALAVLQPARRRVRRVAREPRADVGRDARRGARGRRARTARSHAGSPSRRSAAPGSSSPRAWSSYVSPTTSSTCGTSTSARSRSGRRTPARRGSSPRAGSSSGPGRCARRRPSRSSASAA